MVCVAIGNHLTLVNFCLFVFFLNFEKKMFKCLYMSTAPLISIFSEHTLVVVLWRFQWHTRREKENICGCQKRKIVQWVASLRQNSCAFSCENMIWLRCCTRDFFLLWLVVVRKSKRIQPKKKKKKLKFSHLIFQRIKKRMIFTPTSQWALHMFKLLLHHSENFCMLLSKNSNDTSRCMHVIYFCRTANIYCTWKMVSVFKWLSD